MKIILMLCAIALSVSACKKVESNEQTSEQVAPSPTPSSTAD